MDAGTISEEIMIFDKRFVMATALVLGFGMAACGGDEDCSGNGTKGEDGKCVCNEGYEANEAGDDCVVKEDNGEGEGEGEGNGEGEGEGEGNGEGEGEGEGEGNGEGETKTCDGENEEYNEGAQDCVCKEGFYRPNKDNTKACIAKPNAELCGNGEIDEGELCDVGVDKNNNGEDDKVHEAAVCSDYKKDVEWQDGGKPGCSTDCMNYSQGSCKSTDHVDDVNSVVSCDATITYDEETKQAAAKATVVSKDNLPVKGTVICANSSQALNALVDDVTLVDATDGNLESIFDASAQTDAGEYACTVYVEVEENKGVFCTADGLKVLTDVNNIGEIALANYTVESQVTADTIAKWTFTNYSNNPNDANHIKTAAIAGLSPEEGSDKELKFTWVPVGDTGATIKIVVTEDNSANKALTAFQVRPEAEGKLGNTQVAAESSHISITDLSNYTITELSMTVKYVSVLYITEVVNESEAVVRTIELNDADNYQSEKVTGFTSGAKAINIYGDNTQSKAFTIDDITIMGAAK